jgi:hypothetical protein
MTRRYVTRIAGRLTRHSSSDESPRFNSPSKAQKSMALHELLLLQSPASQATHQWLPFSGLPHTADRLRQRMPASRDKRADFDDLIGKWTPDPAFDEIIATQRQIDPDKWK